MLSQSLISLHVNYHRVEVTLRLRVVTPSLAEEVLHLYFQ